MSVTSADPAALGEFTNGVRAGRSSVASEQGSVAALQSSVHAGSSDYRVDVPAIGALATLLGSMTDNQAFVATVRRELVAADRHGSGQVTVGNSVIAGALDARGVGSPPEALEFDPATMVGKPPTSGFVDDPICAANGNMVHHDTDLVFPGFAAALDVHRTYNSIVADRVGAFGPGWTSILDVRLDTSGAEEPGRVEMHLPDGAIAGFVRRDDGFAPTSRRVHAIEVTPTGWTVWWDHRRTFEFDEHGVLIGWGVGAVRVLVERDDLGRLASATESLSGRSWSVVWSAGGHVDQLVSDDGRRVSYDRGDDGSPLRVSSASGHLDYHWSDTLLTSVVDADGVAAFVNEYDDERRVAVQTSPFGRVTSYRYEIPGATVITDERGVRQAMVHDARGNLTAVVDTDGSAMRMTYDAADRMTAVADKSGNTTQYRFDDRTGELIERVDPDGLSASWSWDERGRLVQRIDRAGSVTTFDYIDGLHTPVRVVGPDGEVVTAEVDPATDLPVVVTDADGVITRFAYDADGQLAGIVNAYGGGTTFEFDTAGLLTHIVDPNGTSTRLDYDAGGRVVRRECDDAVADYVRTAAGRISAGSEPGDEAWSATFGEHGAPVSFADALGSTVRYDYDSTGNVTAVTAPDGATYRNEFDDVGRLVAIVDPAGATIRKGYDREGRLVEFVDADGRTTRRELDPFGRTVRSTAADGAITAWTYHPNGEYASVTAPDGRTWRTEVDRAGRLTSVVDPTGGRSEMTYTAAGRLASRRSPAGRTEHYEYDRAGRCRAVVDAAGRQRQFIRGADGRVVSVAGGDSETPIGVEWDAHGRLRGIGSAAGRSLIERDAAGRVLHATDAAGARTSYDWDPRGLLVAATDPAGGRSEYGYDSRGRLVAQTTPGGRSSSWSYDAIGRVESATDPAGVTTRLGRDATGHLTSLRRDASGWERRLDDVGRETERNALDGTPLAHFDYDVAGRLTTASTPDGLFNEFLWDDNDHLSTVTGPSGTTVIERDADGWATAMVQPDGVRTTFRRDLSGAIVGVADDEAGPGAVPITDVVADPAGKLLLGPDGTAYRYDDASRLVEIAPSHGRPSTFEYDAYGLIAVETGPAGVRRFEYDLAGRVSSIDIDGLGLSAFEYDDAGRRSLDIGPDGTRTRYRWRGLDQLVEIVRTSPNGDVTTVTIDIDAFGRPQRINGRLVEYDPTSGMPARLGDVRVVNLGAIAWRSDDGVWGRMHPGTPEGLKVGLLTVLGARIHDARTHQFLSADPLTAVPGTNGAASAYTYAWHDPINRIDPSGMRPISQEEYAAIREREESGRLGQAWNAIKEDPWGTLVAVGVVAAGVGLMFVPGGQVIGAGILIGAAVSAGTGLATGTFDPRQVALGGVVGGIGAGVGVAFTSTTAAVVSGGAIGAGNDLASQVISGRPIDWRSVAVNGGVGAATGGIGAGTASYTSTMTRSVVVGAATDGGGDIVTQALTGDGSINWGQVAVSTTGGGIDSAVTHHLESSSHALTPEPQQLALTAAPERLALPAGPTPETVTVYRGTHLTAEIDFQQQTGTMMSEAARQAFAGTGDVDIANSYSASAHQRAVEIWGSERDYVQAHGAFGREIVDVSGDRTMVSVTTDRSIAEGFAKESGGVVFRGEVPADSLLAQTLDGAGESEYLAPHWIPMVPDVP